MEQAIVVWEDWSIQICLPFFLLWVGGGKRKLQNKTQRLLSGPFFYIEHKANATSNQSTAPPITSTFHILHFTMSPPSDSEPLPLSFLYIAAKPTFRGGTVSWYRISLSWLLAFGPSLYMKPPPWTQVWTPKNNTQPMPRFLPWIQKESAPQIHISLSPNTVCQSDTCFLQVGHKIVLLDNSLEVRVHANGTVFSWDGALPYSRYIGTIPTDLRNDEKNS